jgi:hypothetical protein
LQFGARWPLVGVSFVLCVFCAEQMRKAFLFMPFCLRDKGMKARIGWRV